MSGYRYRVTQSHFFQNPKIALTTRGPAAVQSGATRFTSDILYFNMLYAEGCMTRKPNRGGQQSDLPKPAELLKLMMFYKRMRPMTRVYDLLKFAGFKIAGLRGTNQADSQSLESLGHRLAWCDKLSFGFCTCGTWQSEDGWNQYMTTAQHGMHSRLATQGGKCTGR